MAYLLCRACSSQLPGRRSPCHFIFISSACSSQSPGRRSPRQCILLCAAVFGQCFEQRISLAAPCCNLLCFGMCSARGFVQGYGHLAKHDATQCRARCSRYLSLKMQFGHLTVMVRSISCISAPSGARGTCCKVVPFGGQSGSTRCR